MDKYLHKDIGEQFSDEINKLSQQPREHIWENIDKALDKTDAKTYKDKFTRLRKRTLLLLLLLIGISTFSVIYFNTSKNKNNPQNAMHDNIAKQEQIIKESPTNNKTNNPVLGNQNASSTNYFNQKQLIVNNIATDDTVQHAEQSLFISRKLFIKENGKIVAKITNGNMGEAVSITENEIETDTNSTFEKSVVASVSGVVKKLEDVKKIITQNNQTSKKDSLTIAANNPSSKNNDKQHKNNSRFTLTAFAAPDYSAYRLTNDKQNKYDNKTGIAKRERSDLSASFGVLLGYKPGKRITLQSGIIYSSSNISITPTKIYAEKENTGQIKYRYNTSSGYGYLLPSFSTSPAVGDSLFADGANHTLRYISIPIIAKYKLGNKKITFNPGVGITLNFVTKATLTTDVVGQFNRETEYITKLEGIKKMSYSLILTPEVQYQLSKKISISVMPYFKYSLGAINKGNVVKSYPYTFGLGAGVVYKF